MKLGSVVILSVFGILNAAHGWSQEERSALRYARICDPSGCYFAWSVVDSDHDGVCDADELMAGTNPYDPLSKPSLTVVAEIAGATALPSFEAGFGAFVVFPEKLQTMLAESRKDALSAFPLKGERGDALTRLGISAELMKEHGIDPSRDGLTIGLERPDENGLPARRVGGIDLTLISYSSAEHGATNSNNESAHEANHQREPGHDSGQGDVHDPNPDPPVDPDPDDRRLDEIDDPSGVHCCYPLLPIDPGAKESAMADGGTMIEFSDGSWVVHFGIGGGVYVDKKGRGVVLWYVNPDVDQGSDPSSEPTPEQEKATLRLRGAVIRTVEGWSAPDFSGTKPQDRRKLIILVDPEYAENTAFVFDLASALNRLNLSQAQPERRPDLRSPGLAAPGGKDCTLGCP